MVKKTTTSPKFSFSGWQITEFIKGQKKTAIAVLGWILGFVFTDNATIATVSASAFALIISTLEYYFKNVKLE